MTDNTEKTITGKPVKKPKHYINNPDFLAALIEYHKVCKEAVAAGKPDDFILQAKGLSATTVAKANPGFNKKLGKPTSSPLTVGDLKTYYRQTGMV